jgi:benzoyl-CoA reductase subunit C
MRPLSVLIEQFKEDSLNRLSSKIIAEGKAQGKKIIGYVCHYTPEEIIYAAGMLPIRILGGPEPSDIGSAYLHRNMCPFARSCLSQGLEKHYDFLDGIVIPHTCDAICKLYDMWRLYVKIPFAFMIDHPHQLTPGAVHYLTHELNRFQKSLEEFAGTPISEESLREAVVIYNTNRSLLKHLYELRKVNAPPISGAETFQVVKASMLLPKPLHTQMLQELLETLDSQGESDGKGSRILVSGSIIEGSEFIQLIEECGAQVVIDNLCVGSKYFWNNIHLDGNILEAISHRYVHQSPCACVYSDQKGFEQLKGLSKDYHVDAVILYSLKFCDTYHYDFPSQKEKLEKEGIPVLELESEHSSGAHGQLKTRIEAFLEMIGKHSRGDS